MHQNDDRLNRICQLIYVYSHDYCYHLCVKTQEIAKVGSQKLMRSVNIQLKSIENWQSVEPANIEIDRKKITKKTTKKTKKTFSLQNDDSYNQTADIDTQSLYQAHTNTCTRQYR